VTATSLQLLVIATTFHLITSAAGGLYELVEVPNQEKIFLGILGIHGIILGLKWS
jgi:hypothetical protein